jgi:ATP-dependent Clp protease ATP-binding subunit ClpB
MERKISLTLSAGAKELLAERGYDPLFGARPLKRTIQSELENPLAKAIISGKVKEGDSITADCAAQSRTGASPSAGAVPSAGLVFKKTAK